VDAVELEHRPQLPLVDHPFDPPIRGLPASVVADLQDDAGAANRAVDPPDFVDRQRERLLNEDVLAGARGADREVRVRGVWRGDHDPVDAGIEQHRVEVLDRMAAVRGRGRLPRLPRSGVARDHDGAPGRPGAAREDASEPPQPDHTQPDRLHSRAPPSPSTYIVARLTDERVRYRAA
jgi:hypothetical protein